MATQDRGFASMDRDRQREIARKGGIAAHEKGTAHEWSPAEAREAGRKGGIASHRQRPDVEAPTVEAPPAQGPAVDEPDPFSFEW